ncbi:MAG: bifunctional glutamate N-acetyltransferase/amino-acid acetyltransferase ArgJ [Candidatus Omnitrophota bacterium]
MVINNVGVTFPKGFLASGIACGLKNTAKKDLALIYSKNPATAAAVFTKNSVWAAPLTVSFNHLKNKTIQAIIINSGNANCFTGKAGVSDALVMCKMVASNLGIKENDVLVASTGIIGKRLAIDKVRNGIPDLIENLSSLDEAGKNAAKAILTTDTFIKQRAYKINFGKKSVAIGAMAKGSGMIAPNMATMLAFITTDAAIDKKILEKILNQAIDRSFNCISVDGCMSTNDFVSILANGVSGYKIQSKNDIKKFSTALNEICLELSKDIIKDGEGRTKFITIEINGLHSFEQAKKAGLAIANSMLFKCACFGNNPNWGRIAAAIGAADLKVKEGDFKINMSFKGKDEVLVKVNFKQGKAKAIIYSTDLTPKYIAINAAYN